MHAIGAPAARTTLRLALQRVEGGFDAAFGAKANPWRHLGGTAFFLFFVVAGTGAYLYAAFDTRVDGAYESVERMTRSEWPLAGIARSLHRYASDAFVVVVLLLSFISTFNQFGLIFLMTGGGPGGATRLYSILAYEKAIGSLQYGPGATIALSVAPLMEPLSCSA